MPEPLTRPYLREIAYLGCYEAAAGMMCPAVLKGGYGILPFRLSDPVSGS